MTKQTLTVTEVGRIQVNVQLPKSSIDELMRLAGLGQAERREHVTQQQLIEQAVVGLVSKLQSKHVRAKS